MGNILHNSALPFMFIGFVSFAIVFATAFRHRESKIAKVILKLQLCALLTCLMAIPALVILVVGEDMCLWLPKTATETITIFVFFSVVLSIPTYFFVFAEKGFLGDVAKFVVNGKSALGKIAVTDLIGTIIFILICLFKFLPLLAEYM